ncbi:MAG: hypothetical protein M9894_03915 [Planctomycetes bacterium]|nr:hypothetical protein [Planctomycetota bacterium]
MAPASPPAQREPTDVVINARLLHACALALALAAGAPAPARAQEPAWADAIVAIVEGEPITLRELELACRLHPAYHDLPRGDSRERQEFRRAILHEGVEKGELGLIAQKVLIHKAREAKVELTSSDEERLNLEIARMAERQPGGIDGLRDALRRIDVPYEYFVERKRSNLHITKLLLTNVSREIFITPTEIRHQYETRRAEFERPGEVRLRQIVLYLDPLEDAMSLRHLPADLRKRIRDKEWDARAFAAELRAKLDAGELAFEHAQRTYSMGLVVDREEVIPAHGLHQAGLFPPVPSRVGSMAVGELSEVVETSGSVRPGPVRALHLLLLVDRQERGVLPLEEVQERLELELKEEVWEKRRDAFIKKARADAHVLVFLPAPGN